jgi:hypothetical protein
MNVTEFPSLYRASDNASIKAQYNYLFVVGLDLIFMILGSLLAIYDFRTEICKTVIYSVSGFFLLCSLILTVVLKSKAFEKTWYEGRALAESVKSLTWRFITCSELFEVTLSKDQVNEIFTRRLKELSKEFKDLNKVMDAVILTQPFITSTMENIRAFTILERRDYYVENRIRNQKSWYSDKAALNNKMYNVWFYVIVLTQFFSLISVIVLIKSPDLKWNFVGLFTTVSAAAISWLQLKQHQELKQAYTTAVQELSFIEVSSATVFTEEGLSRFVLDSENAISREHTLWLAQKE